ncbi:InlB B-repeat-containing protein, partial [Candidatus Marithrix sp. Canyon 246]|uniref:InlB B-repeat-containing protein n=1 Tax=Candidatus Marithrix sp. Canyon 246 TaxID=1827136 RepID=UPI001C0B17A8
HLHSNQLTGTIPNFNALPNLQYLQETVVTSQVLLKRIIITATPEQCYKFTAWGGACSGTSSSCQLTMDSNKPVTANFEIQSFKLNISSDNGNVERQPNKTIYNCGETVNLTAKPNQAYKFKAFRGDANGSNQNITINMDANKNITAIFEPVTSQPTTSTNEKYAIIIAASGAHKQNSLFPYSNDLALRMYRTLFSRGYKHENIIYMNPHKWQDLHGTIQNFLRH